MEKEVEEEGDREPCPKEIVPQMVGSLPASIPKPVKGVGIKRAKEIEGKEEGKKARPHGSHDGVEHGGMQWWEEI